MGWFAVLVALLVLVLSFLYLLPPPPAPVVPTTNTRGKPLSVPGPILGARTTGVNLDGLTIIPLLHLPPIKVALQIPFTSTVLTVALSPTLSETVFTTLRLASISFAAPDALRTPSQAKLSGLTTTLTSSVGWTLSCQIGTWKKRKLRGSARLACALADARVSLALQLVNPDAPRLAVLSTRFDAGEIESVVLSHSIGSGIATRLVPFIKDTVLLRRPLQLLATYLAAEVLEGSDVDELLRDLYRAGKPHVDAEMWGALVDDERGEQAASFLPPSASASPAIPASSPTEAPPLPSPLPPKPFSLHTYLIGPTVLHSFPIPSFSPPLYRPGGTRALLQSLNPLTGPLALSCTSVLLSRITFSSAVVVWDAKTLELVITLEEFSATLSSALEISAPTSALLARLTTVNALRTSAHTSTLVESHALQLRFARPPGKSSISPFSTITPTITLPSPFLALGADMINAVTGAAKAQIAVGASAVVGKFVRERVGDWVAEGLERGKTLLDERGVEWQGSIPWS